MPDEFISLPLEKIANILKQVAMAYKPLVTGNENNKLLVANTSLAADEFDGETVLLDVVRGLYFSLSGTATELWRAFCEQRSATEVIDTLCLQLAGADRAALQDAIQSMCDNQLLVPAAESSSNSCTPFTVATTTFALPTVEVFSDLAYLIAIDPVHEVNPATGWPVRPGNFPNVG